ncbi:hypothetical protein FOA52_000442 [Chlamydomonas sp. UWO 241]|nr:hypothetical protein FOA52_000442 [Chlamydomonas sp. UWO 241]
MIVLLSPAKALDLVNPGGCFGLEPSQPVFAAQAELLVSELQKLTQPQLKGLLGVSDDLAKLNHGRYREWGDAATVQKPCALAFNGPAYQHLRAPDFTPQEATRSQVCVRILSGLYGLLKPLDLIKPYRLDMGSKLQNSRGGPTFTPSLAPTAAPATAPHPPRHCDCRCPRARTQA